MIHGKMQGPFMLALAETVCWKCGKTTAVAALIGRDDADDPEREESFLTGIEPEQMPAELGQSIQEIAPNYKPTHSGTLGVTTWANACEHCDALQGHFYMHMEPDGPFFPDPQRFGGSVVELAD